MAPGRGGVASGAKRDCRVGVWFGAGWSKRGSGEVVEATNGQSVLIEGADHSLEMAGDVVQSLRAMKRLMRAMEAFLN